MFFPSYFFYHDDYYISFIHWYSYKPHLSHGVYELWPMTYIIHGNFSEKKYHSKSNQNEQIKCEKNDVRYKTKSLYLIKEEYSSN